MAPNPVGSNETRNSDVPSTTREIRLLFAAKCLSLWPTKKETPGISRNKPLELVTDRHGKIFEHLRVKDHWKFGSSRREVRTSARYILAKTNESFSGPRELARRSLKHPAGEYARGRIVSPFRGCVSLCIRPYEADATKPSQSCGNVSGCRRTRWIPPVARSRRALAVVRCRVRTCARLCSLWPDLVGTW